MNIESSKEYLIKISSKILGPFSEDEISSMIIDQQLSLIDEIKRPLGRWVYIREERKFLDVIQKIRDQIENTNEITESSEFRRSQDLTPTPTPTPAISRNPGQQVREGLLRSEAIKNSQLDRGAVPIRVNKFSYFRSPALWGVLIIVTSIIGGLIFKKHFDPRTSGVTQENFKQLRIKGLDRVALKKFGQISHEDKFREGAIEEMAGLLIAYEGRGPDLKNYLEEKLNSASDDEEKAKYENFLGIALLQEKKFEASREHFQRALQFAPLTRAVEINMALLDLTREDYLRAYEQFQTMLDSRLKFDEEQRRLIDLGFLFSFYQVFSSENLNFRKKQYRKFEKEFDRIFLEIDKEYFLAFERAFLLYQVRSFFYQENLDMFFDRVLSRLLHPLDLMKKNEIYFWKWLTWDHLSKTCKVHDPGALQDLLLKAICDLNDHRDEEAEMKLKDLASRSESSPSTLITLGYFLYRIGRTEESRSQMNMAVTSFPKNPMALHLLGAICRELQNDACVRGSFSRLLQLNPSNTDAFLALSQMSEARINIDLRPFESLLPLIDRLHYFPYLEWKSTGSL